MQYVVMENRIQNSAQEKIFYGIAVGVMEDGIFTQLDGVTGITTDKESLGALTRLCNDFNLSPIHLREIIEDYLGK